MCLLLRIPQKGRQGKAAREFVQRCLVIVGPAASDIFGPGPGTEQDSLTNVVQTQTDRDGHVPQMHSNEGAANIHAGMSANVLHGHRVLKAVPGGGGKGAAGLGLGMDADRIIAILPGTGTLQNQRTVQMFAALGGKEDAPLLQQGINPLKGSLSGFQAGSVSNFSAKDFRGRAEAAFYRSWVRASFRKPCSDL